MNFEKTQQGARLFYNLLKIHMKADTDTLINVA